MNLKYLISLSFTCTLLAACGATGTQFSGITPPKEKFMFTVPLQ